jgi:hypothetical protein
MTQRCCGEVQLCNEATVGGIQHDVCLGESVLIVTLGPAVGLTGSHGQASLSEGADKVVSNDRHGSSVVSHLRHVVAPVTGVACMQLALTMAAIELEAMRTGPAPGEA